MYHHNLQNWFAPISVIAPTVATKVFAHVIISSPGLIPRATRDNLIASVPELTQLQIYSSLNL